jgi:hypothetical protein
MKSLIEAFIDTKAKYQAANAKRIKALDDYNAVAADQMYIEDLKNSKIPELTQKLVGEFEKHGFTISEKKEYGYEGRCLLAEKNGASFKLTWSWNSRNDEVWRIEELGVWKSVSFQEKQALYKDISEIEDTLEQLYIELDTDDLPDIPVKSYNDEYDKQWKKTQPLHTKAKNDYDTEYFKPGKVDGTPAIYHSYGKTGAIKATVLSMDGDEVKIKTENGATMNVPKERISLQPNLDETVQQLNYIADVLREGPSAKNPEGTTFPKKKNEFPYPEVHGEANTNGSKPDIAKRKNGAEAPKADSSKKTGAGGAITNYDWRKAKTGSLFESILNEAKGTPRKNK